jgi:hypothetical protein
MQPTPVAHNKFHSAAADIEAALPPLKEGLELPPPPPRSPRRPALNDLSSTDEDDDVAPVAPLKSVLTQVQPDVQRMQL